MEGVSVLLPLPQPRQARAAALRPDRQTREQRRVLSPGSSPTLVSVGTNVRLAAYPAQRERPSENVTSQATKVAYNCT